MSKTLVFAGYTDDTFGEITPRGDDYDNCASGKPIEWLVESPSTGEAVIVFGQHAPGHVGGWMVGVGPYDPRHEDTPIAPWPYRLRAPKAPESAYSPVLEIDAPDDATIRCLQVERRDD